MKCESVYNKMYSYRFVFNMPTGNSTLKDPLKDAVDMCRKVNVNYSELIMYGYSYYSGSYQNELMKSIEKSGGKLFQNSKQVDSAHNTYVDMLNHIYDAVPNEYTTPPELFYNKDEQYTILTPTGWKDIELKERLKVNETTDTDEDGLTDWEEIDHDSSMIKYSGDGTPMMPSVKSYLYQTSDQAYKWANRTGLWKQDIRIEVLPIKSDPSKKDSDGDGDVDNIDPEPLIYTLNGYFIKQMERLYLLAVKYNEKNKVLDIPTLYTVGRAKYLPFMLLRSLRIDNGTRRYENEMWTLTAGEIDNTFIGYVQENAGDLYDYLEKTNEIYANSHTDRPSSEWETIDLYHMAATISAMMFNTQTVICSQILPALIVPSPTSQIYKGLFVYLEAGILDEENIDNLAGWAGDLQTLVAKDILQVYNMENTHNKEVAEELFNKYFLSRNSRFSLNDLYADIDAANIYNCFKNTNKSFDILLRDYYKYQKNWRFISFTEYKREDIIRNIVTKYVNKTYNLVPWPLYVISEEKDFKTFDNNTQFFDITNELRDGVVNGFVTYLFDQIDIENRGG